MDAATAAAMSDPDRNPAFRRRWREACTPPDPLAGEPPADLEPGDALELAGRELLEQWRRGRARPGGSSMGGQDAAAPKASHVAPARAPFPARSDLGRKP